MSYYHKLYTYPKIDSTKDSPLYYVVFSKLKELDPLNWTLFKRNFIRGSNETISEYKLTNDRTKWSIYESLLFASREGHPYNLGGGKVESNPNAIGINTESFLKFMVDSLNKNCEINR